MYNDVTFKKNVYFQNLFDISESSLVHKHMWIELYTTYSLSYQNNLIHHLVLWNCDTDYNILCSS